MKNPPVIKPTKKDAVPPQPPSVQQIEVKDEKLETSKGRSIDKKK